MPTKPPQVPHLNQWPSGALFPLGKVLWEPHPDNRGGMRPIDPASRGIVEMPCPYCTKPMIRQGSAEVISISVFRCKPCGKVSAGADVHPVAPKPKPSGA